MKIIVSHDVDHLYLSEHWRDTFVPGLLRRTISGMVKGQISLREAFLRFSWQLNRLNELHEFNLSKQVPATYFFGMRRGLNLSYHWSTAQRFITQLKKDGAEVGLHGMAFDNLKELVEEKRRIELLLDRPVIGVRNHYLRRCERTFTNMATAGFVYDSTLHEICPPTKIGEMWEIPIAVMDVQLFKETKPNIANCLSHSWRLLEDAERAALPYFVINFHDLYFSGGWPIHKAWYIQFVGDLIECGYQFTTFQKAVDELNS